MNKRGAFLSDIGIVLAVMLLFSITILVGYKVFTSYNDKWQANPEIDVNSKALVGDLQSRYVGLFDGIFVFVFVLMAVMLFVSSMLIGTNPAFFFVVLFLTVFLIGVSAIMSNVYEDVATSDQMNTTSSSFSSIPYIMDNLPKIALMFAVITMIGLFVKIKGYI
jgi:succinate-acetate transporter protein